MMKYIAAVVIVGYLLAVAANCLKHGSPGDAMLAVFLAFCGALACLA